MLTPIEYETLYTANEQPPDSHKPGLIKRDQIRWTDERGLASAAAAPHSETRLRRVESQLEPESCAVPPAEPPRLAAP